MIINELESRTKVCCQNREYLCTGAQCMGWVWREDLDDNHDAVYKVGHCGLVPYHGMDSIGVYLLEEVAQWVRELTGNSKIG
jgi:hypothetical protein